MDLNETWSYIVFVESLFYTQILVRCVKMNDSSKSNLSCDLFMHIYIIYVNILERWKPCALKKILVNCTENT